MNKKLSAANFQGEPEPEHLRPAAGFLLTWHMQLIGTHNSPETWMARTAAAEKLSAEVRAAVRWLDDRNPGQRQRREIDPV